MTNEVKTTRSTRRLGRVEKIEKKLKGVSAGAGVNTGGIYTIVLRAKRVPVEIQGFLVEQNEHNVIFRHKRSSGSRKMRKDVFPARDVVEVFGAVGEASSIVVMMSKIISTSKGYIAKSKTSGLIRVKDITTGSVSTVYPNNDVYVEIFEDEEEEIPSGRGRSKTSNVVNIAAKRRSVKANEEESYDDEL
jgi:hypothetical protein